MIKNLLLTICGLAMLFAAPVRMSAQMEFRYLTDFGTSLRDINSSGKAVTGNSTFDFATSTLTPADTNVLELFNINDFGDLTGSIALAFQGNTMSQPAYKLDGTWYPIGYFPGFDLNATFSVGQISENRKYVAGQMSTDGFSNFEAYLFNTSLGLLEQIADPANEYSAAYTVNNNGILGGWFDPQPEGSGRIPAYMTTGSVVTPVLAQLPPQSNGQVTAINNSNLLVGDLENKPFIYNLAADTYKEYEIPAGYTSATFTSVSDNGIAVGYCQTWDGGGLVRDAIVYHPSLGPQPVLIKDILANNGVTETTADGKLGTAIAISPDGNYVCGWDNSAFFFARGWAINFKDLLINTCYLECPSNIEIVNLSGPIAVEYELTSSCEENPSATIKFVSGLESGAIFPVGTTQVVYQLVDADSTTVLNTCSFNITVVDEYCNPTNPTNFVEPITLVQVADINNESPEDATSDYEDFTSIVGHVTIGNTYIAKCKGNTGGSFTDYFNAFIDWDQNGHFDPTNEVYQLGSITNSTGIDDSITSGEIVVPMDALVGTTTMRIVKNWDFPAFAACSLPSFYGQIEDYKLNVGMVNTVSLEHSNIRCYPNPANEVLYLSNTEDIENIEIFNVLGQSALSVPTGSSFEQINVSSLITGMYVVKIEMKSGKQYSTKFTKN